MTEGSQEFCLRWNNHQATIISVFDYLLENETLVDCTLAAEGQYLKAHKVVLCACSPYLELLLSQHNDKHPILIFKDIKYNELKCMIEYMYKGEVNIAQDQLNHFLKAAESLQIKGLSESEDETAPQTAVPAPRPPPPRAPPVQRIQPRPISSSLAVESPKRINRNEAASPTRKRRRLPQGRPSLSGDDASNASESHLDQSNCDVPSNVQPSNDNAVAKLETNSELMLEPKTEYDDNSVEDITLDDDDEEYSQAGTSMDNSQMNFSGWQGMDKSGGDEVFSGQDSGAQNSQETRSWIPEPVDSCKPTKPHWHKTQRKYLRNTGQMYSYAIRSKVFVRKARELKEPCKKVCRKKCAVRISHARRQEIFNEFWSLESIEEKRIFIARLIDKVKPKNRRSSSLKRDFNTACYLPNENGKLVSVCITFFLNTLDVSKTMLNVVRRRMEMPEFTFAEFRGKFDRAKKRD